MRLYHGSIEIVDTPEIREPDHPLDYGTGFYTTTSYDQAKAWVKRKARQKNARKGYVNVFEFDEKEAEHMKCLIFNTPTDEWVDFVMANRTKQRFEHSYDIVYGPVANDRVYAAFALYEGGVLDKQSLINELKVYKLVDQYLFHTEGSLRTLKFIKSEEVDI